MEGLSAKSVVLNFVCQLVVFLYLLDNDTSWMILASSGIGVCIEFWKIGKAMHIEVKTASLLPLVFIVQSIPCDFHLKFKYFYNHHNQGHKHMKDF
jgi:hypothetical protein